jgi:uroporphyrinogen-III decarboxylase
VDFAPSVYEHAAQLIGRTPWAVSRDADLMFEAHAAAYRLYGHEPVVVGIDIYNLEAEAYGGVVAKPFGNGSPAVTEPICTASAELADLSALEPGAGRIPIVLAVGQRLAEEFPEADVRIPVSGPFSIAASLLGVSGLLCEVAADPDAVRAGLDHLADGQVAFCRAVVDAGLDIAFFESAAAPPLLSPGAFRSVELPPLKELILRSAEVVGHPVPCIIGGDTAPILDAILETGTGYVICPAETDQAEFMWRIWNRTEVRVRVNTRPEVVASGSWDEIREEIEGILGLCAGRPNVCLGTGALPYETPPANVLRMKDYMAGKP